MDTLQILCTLRNVKSFLGVFPSDILPNSITPSGTVIINADPHTEKGSHWLAIHFETKASSAYYSDSYGISPIIPAKQAFVKRNCTVWVYNTVQLQGLTSTVCGQYCCLFALYMDKGYTPKQFIDFSTLTYLTGILKNYSHWNSKRYKKTRGVNAAAPIRGRY